MKKRRIVIKRCLTSKNPFVLINEVIPYYDTLFHNTEPKGKGYETRQKSVALQKLAANGIGIGKKTYDQTGGISHEKIRHFR